MKVLSARGSEKEDLVNQWVSVIEKEIEPLLADADPFFGGSKNLTLGEVIPAPFMLRWFALSDDGELVTSSFAKRLRALPDFGKWAKAVTERKTVLEIWDEETVLKSMKARLQAVIAKHKA